MMAASCVRTTSQYKVIVQQFNYTSEDTASAHDTHVHTCTCMQAYIHMHFTHIYSL
jgi:hypothetical protein